MGSLLFQHHWLLLLLFLPFCHSLKYKKLQIHSIVIINSHEKRSSFGFEVKNISWANMDIFEKTVEDLLQKTCLVTATLKSEQWLKHSHLSKYLWCSKQPSISGNMKCRHVNFYYFKCAIICRRFQSKIMILPFKFWV